MAILHLSDIRAMDANEMDEQMTELQGELMKIRGISASGGIPEDIGKAREIRRTIARILTIKKEKEKR